VRQLLNLATGAASVARWLCGACFGTVKKHKNARTHTQEKKSKGQTHQAEIKMRELNHGLESNFIIFLRSEQQEKKKET
jgi:hypothetical protein